jgi:hypothetical protein
MRRFGSESIPTFLASFDEFGRPDAVGFYTSSFCDNVSYFTVSDSIVSSTDCTF